jgi:alkylation response protein AidB-like acyl-CoA dehydrogenase
MGTLAFERVAIATGRVNTTGAVNDLIRQISCRTTEDGTPLGADPLVRQRIADLYGRALVHYLIGQRVITGAAGDGPPGPVTSIGKLFFCPLVEDIADFGLELDEMGGQFSLAEKSADDSSSADSQRWLRLAYQARGTAIAGGSTFIQRNIVAERILGMPKS